jgi:hypothetical protein
MPIYLYNLEEEEIVDVRGKDVNALMPEEVKRPNPWRKMTTQLAAYRWTGIAGGESYKCN